MPLNFQLLSFDFVCWKDNHRCSILLAEASYQIMLT